MNRRRRGGIAGIQSHQERRNQFSQVGAQLEAENAESIAKHLALFKSHLEDFAKKHKKQINRDPEFRMQFGKMCHASGVDPLASTKGFWAELLGVGDFYYELAVQVSAICLSTREQNGGLIEVTDLLDRLRAKRGPNAQKIAEYDIEKAIKVLEPLGSGFRYLTIGASKFVQSVPTELNMDHFSVLSLAEDKKYVTKKEIMDANSWSEERTDAAMDVLQQGGMTWIDDSPGNDRRYWVLSMLDLSQ